MADKKSKDDELAAPKTDQDRGAGDYIALGIGCLVVVIFFGGVLYAGLMSGR